MGDHLGFIAMFAPKEMLMSQLAARCRIMASIYISDVAVWQEALLCQLELPTHKHTTPAET
jgi:hypothetical protein